MTGSALVVQQLRHWGRALQSCTHGRAGGLPVPGRDTTPVQACRQPSDWQLLLEGGVAFSLSCA